jgi:two-component system response regulator LytT
MNINCIIIDDDPLVQGYLEEFTTRIPFLNLISVHSTPADALHVLEAETVQLIFLDISMPDVSGIEFAKMLNDGHGESAPRIIFISGYERFALDGYKVNALDYLLKPPTYEDFFKAVYKAKTHFEALGKHAESAADYTEHDFIFLRVEHQLTRVYLKNILYIEGFKDYVKVYLAQNESYIKALTTMKSIEEKLPVNSFMRVHRSFIISLDKIDAINKNAVQIGKTLIPVTTQFKDDFKKFTDQWF